MDNLKIVLAHASTLDRMANQMLTELDDMGLIGEVVRAALVAESEMRSYAAWSVAQTLINSERIRLIDLLREGPRSSRQKSELEELTQQYLSGVDAAVNLAGERVLHLARKAVGRNLMHRQPGRRMLPNDEPTMRRRLK